MTSWMLPQSCENQVSMASSHKKVIVRKLGRDSLSGYVSPANFIVEGQLDC